MSERMRVRTGLLQTPEGQWRVVVEVNGHKMLADGSWSTEQEAETAAVGMANRVRGAVGMPSLDGGGS